MLGSSLSFHCHVNAALMVNDGKLFKLHKLFRQTWLNKYNYGLGMTGVGFAFFESCCTLKPAFRMMLPFRG